MLMFASVCDTACRIHVSGRQRHLTVSFDMLSSFTFLNLAAALRACLWRDVFFVTSINILAMTVVRICW